MFESLTNLQWEEQFPQHFLSLHHRKKARNICLEALISNPYSKLEELKGKILDLLPEPVEENFEKIKEEVIQLSFFLLSFCFQLSFPFF